MHFSQVLYAPPVFRYWKHFGAGLRRRQPNFKQWKYKWYAHIDRRKIPDHTIPKDMLPPGSRIMEAEELLEGPIEAMPDEIIKMKRDKVVYDHPWPFNVNLNPIKDQELMYCYDIHTRFFKPRDDCLVLTNTLLESDALEASPPLEPSAEHMEYLKRQFAWATEKDSVLVRLPKKRMDWPKVNKKPIAQYGLSKERKESNILSILSNYSQTLLARHYHDQGQDEKLNAILSQRSLSYPHCQVPFKREAGKKINLNLYIDSILMGKEPLPQIDPEPTRTKQIAPLNIKPRTWRSLLEQTRDYSQSWSFSLPSDVHLHTIQLNSHIKRDHRDVDEMLARCIVHAFGVSSQYARLQALSSSTDPSAVSRRAGCILQNPLDVAQVNDKDLLDRPVVVQTISYDHSRGEFDFVRFQLNSLNFDDNNQARVKNQAWHSGPISDLDRALRYYLDFLSFDTSMAAKMRSSRVETGNEAVDNVEGGSIASGSLGS